MQCLFFLVVLKWVGTNRFDCRGVEGLGGISLANTLEIDWNSPIFGYIVINQSHLSILRKIGSSNPFVPVAWQAACCSDGQDLCQILGGESRKSAWGLEVEQAIHIHHTQDPWSCQPNYVTNMHGMLLAHGFKVAGKRNNTSWVPWWSWDLKGPFAKVGDVWGGWDTNPVLTLFFQLPLRKLRWQWKITMFNRRYIFKWLVFHCHISFPGW